MSPESVYSNETTKKARIQQVDLAHFESNNFEDEERATLPIGLENHASKKSDFIEQLQLPIFPVRDTTMLETQVYRLSFGENGTTVLETF